MTDDAVLALLRQHFAGLDAMHLCPSVPGQKELAARAVHGDHLPSHERVLALFDDTLFGSADEGFLITARRICWKNPRGGAQMIEWQDVDPDHMYAEGRKLALGPAAIELAAEEVVVDACETAFHVLAFSARASRADHVRSGVVDSYPTHAASQRGPSFACWHCHTPLHWNTPQCARCSAGPAPQGWQRTG